MKRFKKTNNIYEIMHESGIHRAKDLADFIGVTPSAACSWLRNVSNPSVENVKSLIEVFNKFRQRKGLAPIGADDIVQHLIIEDDQQ
jgi:transcriptional regulator with XRE-family HTH domain